MILELEETKQWLRVDGYEDDEIISTIMGATEEYLQDATGIKFDNTTYRAKLYCLALCTDWYENRELIGLKPSEKVRFSLQSIMLQLQNAPLKGVDASG